MWVLVLHPPDCHMGQDPCSDHGWLTVGFCSETYSTTSRSHAFFAGDANGDLGEGPAPFDIVVLPWLSG